MAEPSRGHEADTGGQAGAGARARAGEQSGTASLARRGQREVHALRELRPCARAVIGPLGAEPRVCPLAPPLR
eukprot:8636384-Alexandrium_andersonii.AAC.1